MSGTWSWQEHEGVRYLELDFRGLDEARATELLLHSVQIINDEPPGVRLLVHNDARMPSVEYARTAMEFGKTVYRPRRTRMAILGLPTPAVLGLRTFNAVAGGNRAIPFRDREQALKFLVAA